MILAADAPNREIRMVVTHNIPNVQRKASAHASQTFTPAEKSTGRLKGGPFSGARDKETTQVIPRPTFNSINQLQVTGRLKGWAIILLGYIFDGKFRKITDLSRPHQCPPII